MLPFSPFDIIRCKRSDALRHQHVLPLQVCAQVDAKDTQRPGMHLFSYSLWSLVLLHNAHLVVSTGLRPLSVPVNCTKCGEGLEDLSFLVVATRSVPDIVYANRSGQRRMKRRAQIPSGMLIGRLHRRN